MIQISKPSECCGCGACTIKCPKNCIQLKPDKQGFLYPSVDQEMCVNCGLCEKVCPIINSRELQTKDAPRAYAAYAQNSDVRISSSSGGIFTLLAREILDQGGCVFGAVYDDDFSVHHIGADSIEALELLKGSKYIQSRTEETFSQVKKMLDSGKTVLYSGVSCQISALKLYLGKDYYNLYTVDVLCHGVPSPALWKRYLEEKEKEYSSKAKFVNFRSKDFGWKKFSLKIEFENGKVYIRDLDEDLFMRFFLKNICLRPSCYDCQFKNIINRQSDITIGDAWGIDSHMPDMDDDKGTSVVIIHSDKGDKWFRQAAKETTIKSCELDTILPPTADSRKSVKPHPNRKKFFRYFAQGESTQQLERFLRFPLMFRIKRKAKNIMKKFSR